MARLPYSNTHLPDDRPGVGVVLTGSDPVEWEILLEALSLDLCAQYTPYLGLSPGTAAGLRQCSRSFLAAIRAVPESTTRAYTLSSGATAEHPYKRQLRDLASCLVERAEGSEKETIFHWLLRGLPIRSPFYPWNDILGRVAGTQVTLEDAPISDSDRSTMALALKSFDNRTDVVEAMHERLVPTTEWDKAIFAAWMEGSPLDILNKLARNHLVEVLAHDVRSALLTEDLSRFLRWSVQQYPWLHEADVDVSTFPGKQIDGKPND